MSRSKSGSCAIVWILVLAKKLKKFFELKVEAINSFKIMREPKFPVPVSDDVPVSVRYSIIPYHIVPIHGTE